jgi:hypothetical protein
MAERVSLASLLPERLDSIEDQVRARLCEDEQVGGMKLAWDFIGRELGDALKSVLDCDLLDVLAQAWAKAAPLADLADPERHPPGERSLVELGGHDINRDFHPAIAVTIGACPCVELQFTFALAAHVGGVRLAVADGHIVGGDLGEIWATAQLSYQGTPLHPECASRKLELPAAFKFDPPGIEIPRLASTRARSG